MKKVVSIAVLVAVAAGIGWYLFTGGAMSLDAAKKQFKRAARDAVVSSSASPEDVAALAVKAVDMTQGEKGFELWRLKADWGSIRRNDDIMELEKPKFTYYMPPDNVELKITSDKGEIEQEDQRIRFMDNVRAMFGERTVTANLILYEGKNRQVIFPTGAHITGASFDGTADRVVWRLQDQVVEATGDVDITFKNDQDVPGPEQQDTADTLSGDAPLSGDAKG